MIATISAFIQHDTVTGIQGLVIGFLLSSYGLQKLAVYVIAFIGAINEGITYNRFKGGNQKLIKIFSRR